MHKLKNIIMAVSPALSLVLLVLLALSCAEKQWPPLDAPALIDRNQAIDCIDQARTESNEPATADRDAVVDEIMACLPDHD